jgi:hypothetical protein
LSEAKQKPDYEGVLRIAKPKPLLTRGLLLGRIQDVLESPRLLDRARSQKSSANNERFHSDVRRESKGLRALPEKVQDRTIWCAVGTVFSFAFRVSVLD